MKPRHIPGLVLLATLAMTFLLACTAAAPGAPGGAPTTLTTDRPASGDDQFDGEDTAQLPDQALIVYSGTLELEVAELRSAIDSATQLVVSLGGHVAASQEINSAGAHAASVTYRVPAARWSEALSGLRAVGQRVLSERTESEDVTAQVVDLDARISNLRATEAALQAIMDRATTISDVLRVQEELSDVRGDIESMIAQRDMLADRAALGTLDVSFEAPVAAANIASEGWDLGRELDGAVAALVRVLQRLASVGIWLVVVVLPVLGPLALIAYAIVRVRRRWLAGRAQRSLPGSV